MSISPGNTKPGGIPNISLPPAIACGNCSPCAKDCYAIWLYKNRKYVARSWDNNYALAIDRPKRYFEKIDEYISKNRPRLFRWHVSGDILDQSYPHNMFAIAKNNPDTKHLAFTKMFWLNYSKSPDTMSIVFSMWPRMRKPRHKQGVSGFYWMQDGTETRMPKGTTECFGTRDSCGMCFNIKSMPVPHIYNIKH
jgi:hypothetical protein